MGSQTAAGTSLAISATGPATHDAAGYAALTFVDIGQVEKLGSFGATFAKSEFQPLKGAKQKYKGSSDNGAIQPSIAIDSADAGQTLLQSAAEDETQKLYSFCVTFADGAKRYFRGRVFGSPETADGADSMLMTTPTVEISTRVVKVAAAVVAPTPTPTFSTQPSVTPTSGTAGTTTFTATPGTVTNGIISSRAWLLNGTSISTTLSASPQSAGTLTYQETAAGAGGSAVSSVISTTVVAAPSPTVTLSGAQSKAEGNSGATLFTYTVTRSASSGAVAVPWSFTAGGTSADDFTGGTYPAGGTVNMAAGVATGTFSISVNGDTVVEGDETFTVLISTPSGYVAGTTTSATGTILNDDVTAVSQQFVGNRGSWQYNPRSATTASNNLHISRFTDKFGAGGTSGATITDVAFTFTTLYSSDVAGPGYIVRADIEINGICVPFTWGGQTSKTLVSGDNDVACDPLLPSQFGLTAFTQGMAYAGKVEKEFAVGVVPVDCGPNTDIAGEGCYRAPAGTASRIGIAGPLNGPAGYTLAYIAHYPVGIIGRVSGGTLPAYASYGASIEAGQNDSLGYCTRASQLGPQIAYSRLALGSETAINFAALNSKRIVFAKYANIASNGYGGNDFSAAKTKEAIATALAQINAQIKAMGVKRIIQTRLSPKSNTTDEFATVENQTPRPNFLDTRAYVDAQAALDPNVNFLNDMSSAMEPSSKPGVWVANGTAKWATLDGTHPESVTHIAMAPVLRVAINMQIGAL